MIYQNDVLYTFKTEYSNNVVVVVVVVVVVGNIYGTSTRMWENVCGSLADI